MKQLLVFTGDYSLTNKKSEQAFTLLELLIVCLLISISLAVAIPSLRLPGLTDDLASDARKIISIVREVKSQAVANQQSYLLHFDTVANTIWFEEEKPGDAERNKMKTPRKVIMRQRSLSVSRCALKVFQHCLFVKQIHLTLLFGSVKRGTLSKLLFN